VALATLSQREVLLRRVKRVGDFHSLFYRDRKTYPVENRLQAQDRPNQSISMPKTNPLNAFTFRNIDRTIGCLNPIICWYAGWK
jgi:hypothetical protein